MFVCKNKEKNQNGKYVYRRLSVKKGVRFRDASRKLQRKAVKGICCEKILMKGSIRRNLTLKLNCKMKILN